LRKRAISKEFALASGVRTAADNELRELNFQASRQKECVSKRTWRTLQAVGIIRTQTATRIFPQGFRVRFASACRQNSKIARMLSIVKMHEQGDLILTLDSG
jgi:hypothetical protein